MPSLSRRALLGVGAAGLATASAGCLGSSSASFETWTPEADTWPLARYDTGNTAHNPNAAVPRDGVSRARERQTDVAGQYLDLVVASDRIVTYGEAGMVVVAESNPETVETDPVPTHAAGFGPLDDRGHRPLFTAGRIGVRDGAAMGLVRGRTFDAVGGWESLWATYEIGGGASPDGLVVGRNALYVGHGVEGPLLAFDAESGHTRWRETGRTPALADGRLVASEFDDVVGYEPRSGFDGRLNDGPATAWTTRGGLTPPVLADGRVFAWSFPNTDADPALYASDAATGDVLWGPLRLGNVASSPAVVGDTGYVGVYGRTEGGETVPGGELVAVDLTDGTVRWRRATDWSQGGPVAAGNGVVVARGSVEDAPKRGRVHAYDADSGDVLWTHATAAPVADAALVGSTVYVCTADGGVHALR